MDYLKIQKAFHRIKHIRNTMDILEYEDNILSLKGWVYAENKTIDDFKLLIKSTEKQYVIPFKYGLERVDVYQFYQNENAKKSGFYGRVVIENLGDFSASFQFTCDGRKEKLILGKFHSEICEKKPVVKMWKSAENGFDWKKMEVRNMDWKFEFPENYYEETFDVIIPVYNGYQFLEKLFETVKKTNVKYNLYVIDDCSPDERVFPLLEKLCGKQDNIHLYKNEKNMGFVKTVNKGLSFCENHVAIVNTDVELPEQWLERLMYPILADTSVASSTPYTNCGTNCSFPKFFKDNEIFLGLDVQSVDDMFQTVKPSYQKLPTGVGFCMGMNKKVLGEIGGFDEDNFGMGYGEENDWCQRAIEAGYKNVQVENMFVFHKHGGSFLSEDKKRYIKEHEKILLKKHPKYNKEISRFHDMDPNKSVREYVAFHLILKHREFENVLAFDHDLGGGATAYLDGKRETELASGKAFTVVCYDATEEAYKLKFYYEDQVVGFVIKDRAKLFEILRNMSVTEIWINELVTYPDLHSCMEDMIQLNKQSNAKMKMLFHDLYGICPTINMLDCDDTFCGVRSGEKCNQCLKKVHSLQYLHYESIEAWRGNWKRLLEHCEEVVVFSNNTKELVEAAYGKLENIKVIPHQIKYMPRLEKSFKTTDTINIGLLGMLLKHKGLPIIKEMVKMIEKEGLNIRFVLIGSSIEKINSPVFYETGEYTRDMIPRLVLENDIDMFLVPAIWPETFSYTTEEIMNMNMPVMSFDIGAPAERIREYEKGEIIPEVSAKAALRAIQESRQIAKSMELPREKKKVLFVVEEITFSSRYRVDHLREQLLYRGISSRTVLVEQCSKCNLKEYSSVVVYRSSKVREIGNLISKAHDCGIKVYYDVDDYIFNYEEIKGLDFLKGHDYYDFETYSKQIQETLEACDGTIVSTCNLYQVIQRLYPSKPVWINRNSASLEMVTISMGVEKEKKEDIVLGYFSGTKTHDKDFAEIREAVMRIVSENPKIRLLVGGQIDLPGEFNEWKDRIDSFEFVDWKKLPALIARADINLMPLEDTLFHTCKSENKWMEAALVGVPTVASWNTELETAIRNGENGYLCNTTEEWVQALKDLIENPEKRKEIAIAAQKDVLERYTTLTIEEDVLEVLTEGK